MLRILIPTDFSENATHAIRYALAFLKYERAKFYFLHAYGNEVYRPLRPRDKINLDLEKEQVKKETNKKLTRLINEITEATPNPKHTYETTSACDLLVDAVNDFVNEINIDMVILGTKGETANTKLIFGSHTVQVFKYASCPVLAIPLKATFHQPKKILFPTDYMLPYKRRELKLLNRLSSMYKSEIYGLYISDFEDKSHRQLDNKGFLKENLSDAKVFFERTAVKNKVEAIREYIALKNIDFLVMVNSRHSFLEDLLYKSTVDEIGLSSNIPFLVLQNLPR